MIFKFLVILAIFGSMFFIDAKKHFPKGFIKCKKDDPNLNECVKNAAQASIPLLVKGLPKHGIMPVDPMEVTSIELMQTLGPIKLNVTFHKVVTKGNGNNIVHKAEANFDKHWFSFTILSPKLTMEGSYTMTATFFGFPIDGSGDFEFLLYNTTTKVDVIGKPVIRKGDEYLKLAETPVKMDVGKIVFNFKNLKNANGELGKNINWFLNRHSDRILREMKFLTEETQSKLALKVSQPFFDRVPYNEMFI